LYTRKPGTPSICKVKAMPKLTKNAPAGKAKKRRAVFPLFKHQRGYWAKKVRGKLWYFGKVATDPDGEAAVEQWLKEKDELQSGRTPNRTPGGGLTIRELCNRFLSVKESDVATKEITRRHFEDLYTACELLIGQFGKDRLVSDLGAADFELLRRSLSRTRGAWALGGVVQKIRSVFKYGIETGLITKVVLFGPGFKRPGKSAIRRERNEKPERMFEAVDLRTIIDTAGQPLKSMVLLAVNAGLGNSDCGQLRFRNIDMTTGWLDFPRPKNGIERRAPLWEETIAGLNEAIAKRPEDTDETTKEFVFLTKYRQPWAKDKMANPISAEFRKLLVELGLHSDGLGFYTLRHVFATIGGGSRDQVAVNAIMGHSDPSMAAHYRERIDDDRLKAVTDHVHRWLWPPKRRAAK
jgi:integrase